MAIPETEAARRAQALLARGQQPEAARLLERALAADPGDLAARRLRGEIAIREGRMEDARRDLETVVRACPEDVAVLHAVAGACHATGSSSAAIAYLERAVVLSPRDPRLWHGLGLVRHGAGQYRAALEAYQRALDLEPGLAAAAVGAGKVWQLLGRLDVARRMFEQVLASDPGNHEAVAGLVLQEELLGNVDRAMDLLASVGRRGPLPPGLVIPWARLQRRAGRPDEAARMLESLLARITDATTRRQALFALGQILDEMGEHDRAFSAISEANALKPGDFDAAAHARRLGKIAGTWTREALRGLKGWGHESARPVFIVGMPRSGTSLLEQILSRHPGVHTCGELSAIGAIAGRWQDDSGVVQPVGLTKKRVADAAREYLKEAEAEGSTVFTDKMPANFLHLGLIQAMFPAARVIHCVRNPQDAGLSCYFQDFSALGLSWSCRLEDIAAYYGSYRELMSHWGRVLDLPLLKLRYESVVTDLEPQIHRVLEFLELPWEPDCLTFHESDRPVITASAGQVSRELYATAIGRHRHYRRHLGPLLTLTDEGESER